MEKTSGCCRYGCTARDATPVEDDFAPMPYYAHSLDGRPETDWHGLAPHLRGTARRAAENAAKFGAADYGHVAGLLHDVGKYAGAFQDRLKGGARVDHSSAGAQLCTHAYGRLRGMIPAYAIAGHHAGLADWISATAPDSGLDRRLTKAVAPYGAHGDEITLPDSLPAPPAAVAQGAGNGPAFALALFTRMIFSCLVDADFLDTEAFYDRAEGRPPRDRAFPAIADLHDALEVHLAALTAGTRASTPDSAVNDRRAAIQDAARAAAGDRPGLFSLTVPTGGGKTLASLLFALAHARCHGLDRVIVAIPYTSIIEQTAATFRAALGGFGDAIVEHHSAFTESRNDGAEARRKLNKAMENWDAPIVVTSNVQLFESLFADRPSRCRKLHNLARSVIILDEAQMLPLPLLRPCLAAISELSRAYGASVVLCTATQPALTADSGFQKAALTAVREIAPDPPRLYRDFKRVTVQQAGRLDDDALAERLVRARQVLCIVNTRAHARDLAMRLVQDHDGNRDRDHDGDQDESRDGADGDRDGVFHLSASMCAAHRSEKLAAIKARLASRAPCRLISTSLIEAGVDVDFPQVYRAVAGLDSIAQAAGRCNREGRRPAGDSPVHVFTPAGVNPPPLLQRQADAGRRVLERHGDDPLSLTAIGDYFREIYWLETVGAEDGLDTRRILGPDSFALRDNRLDFNFATVARAFRMIDSDQRPVLIPYDDRARALIAALADGSEKIGPLARRLQRYTVQVPPAAFDALKRAGVIATVDEHRLGDQFWALGADSFANLYSPRYGLDWRDPTYRAAERQIF
ncbi:CRISPR-associated endonuclease Cas3'' [Eilatimonas milleporae]|uniref:CRISPR-associated endonuclease Cas3'' n=1 Tax=Eilatimonas milleporae TaxID=911205 RepID=UPI001B86B4C9|nr:CRISPR-associated endonuclease Cas3'' [Eilatimonas milleporae]